MGNGYIYDNYICHNLKDHIYIGHNSEVLATQRQATPLPVLTAGPTGVCTYGDWVMVDNFDRSFWPQRTEMGHSVLQKPFNHFLPSFKEMLDWAKAEYVDWGWTEGAKYSQLFHKAHEGGTAPAFAATISVKGMDDCRLDGNDPGKGRRYSFVRKEVLLDHRSWRNTKARSLYLASLSRPSNGTDMSNVAC